MKPVENVKVLRSVCEKDAPLGDVVVQLVVLEDETTGFAERSIAPALGRSPSGDRGELNKLPVFLAASNLKPFIHSDLLNWTNIRIPYYAGSQQGGRPSNLIPAWVLPRICEAYVNLFIAGEARADQMETVLNAQRILMAFAQVGVVAWIHEVTGYQAKREADALQNLLQFYILPDAMDWELTFEQKFFLEVCRLRNWSVRSEPPFYPSAMAQTIDQLFYDKLPPSVSAELKEVNPRDPETGTRKRCKHQHLTGPIRQRLIAMIQSAVALMERYGDGRWEAFKRAYHQAWIRDWGNEKPDSEPRTLRLF